MSESWYWICILLCAVYLLIPFFMAVQDCHRIH